LAGPGRRKSKKRTGFGRAGNALCCDKTPGSRRVQRKTSNKRGEKIGGQAPSAVEDRDPRMRLFASPGARFSARSSAAGTGVEMDRGRPAAQKEAWRVRRRKRRARGEPGGNGVNMNFWNSIDYYFGPASPSKIRRRRFLQEGAIWAIRGSHSGSKAIGYIGGWLRNYPLRNSVARRRCGPARPVLPEYFGEEKPWAPRHIGHSADWNREFRSGRKTPLPRSRRRRAGGIGEPVPL